MNDRVWYLTIHHASWFILGLAIGSAAYQVYRAWRNHK